MQGKHSMFSLIRPRVVLWSVPIYVYITVVTLFLIFTSACALNDSNDLVLTLTEKKALDSFKSQVIDSLPEKFMKTDFYLIRWLRVAKLDVSKAQELLTQTVQWRQNNNITNILNEDWSDMEAEYGMTFKGVDREGRPITTIEIGDWHLRAAALQGKTQRLQRYLTYSNEMNMQRIFKEQEKGTPVTRAMILVDSDGLNLRQHLCPSCLAVLTHWATNGEANYPMFSDEIILINAPSTMTFALNIIRPFLSASTRDQMKIFNTNKQEWQAYLDKRIDKTQRSPRYGGTMN